MVSLGTEKAETSRDLEALQAKLDRVTSENSNLSEYARNRDSEVSALTGEIEQLRAKVSNGDADLVATQYQVSTLTNQLKGQQTAVEEEHKLLEAGRDVRDLMSARNLHIIDVHDVDARGESHPFGRIFLTDRKRLIFYAYD